MTEFFCSFCINYLQNEERHIGLNFANYIQAILKQMLTQDPQKATQSRVKSPLTTRLFGLLPFILTYVLKQIKKK